VSGALRVCVGGRPFVITPEERLSPDEHRVLQRLSSDDGDGRDFVIHLSDDPPLAVVGAPHDGEPAEITVEGDRVQVTHERFTGVITPETYEAVIHRHPAIGATAIEIVLRTALSCRLPLEDGVLLHSAGIIINDRAALFFGVSGAGKSTMTEMMGGVALSDELVAVSGDDVRATGFWGSLDRDDAPRQRFPLGALVNLGRGDGVHLERLNVRVAARRLLLATVVPPHPWLWSHALRVVERLAHRPVFHLVWSPSEENAREVASRLVGEWSH
jgi:hypothetical protein